MDSDVAEIRAQAGFHETTGIPIERRPAARADNVFDERRLLLLEGGADAGVARHLLEVHHSGGCQDIGPSVHQRLRTRRLCGILALSWRLVTLRTDQKIVFVRLHAHASVELTLLPIGAQDPSD